MTPVLPRRFHLQRDHDVSGVSGTGRVANGVLWPDGTTSLRWIGERPSTVHWDRLADAEHVHGHGGATRIVWDDQAVHAGGNAENCPACRGTNPPYPFICPGPGAEQLPADQTADRAAALREAADEIAGIDFHPNARARSLDIATGLARRLRRMADETQPAETECPEREQPVYLSTPCAVCAHPYNWHCGRSACEFGSKENLCGCRSFTPGEEPATGARQDGAQQ